MILPIIESRMEQASYLAGFWIEAGKVHAFVQIAVVASEREIIRRIFSSMLTGNDVLDMKGQRLLVLPQLAIFAGVFCASPDELTQPVVHQAAFARASALRALAWRIPMTVLPCTYASYSARSFDVNLPSLHFSASFSTRACMRLPTRNDANARAVSGPKLRLTGSSICSKTVLPWPCPFRMQTI